jgi:heme/copper-type cytochrome/quinol oxidase subunit 2
MNLLLVAASCFLNMFEFIRINMGNLISPLLVSDRPAPYGFDTSIEGLSSQQFSVGIFYFLVLAILVFVGIVFMFMLKGRKPSKDKATESKAPKLKKGEMVLFAWLLLGVVVAIIFGAAQMLDGYLF